MEEKKYRIPKEVYDWFKENGCIYTNGGDVYAMSNSWYELLDDVKCLVKFHQFDNLPKKLKEVHKSIVNKWNDAIKNPPKESGRYWCYVSEVNDLGISHFEWNCSYDAQENIWQDNLKSINVTHWTELLGKP